MKIFVTGGSGFVGGHVIERLAPSHSILALARSEGSAAKVRAYGAEPVLGSLGVVAASALRGVDAVVHCAAYVEEWGTRAQFWSANVDGTQQLLDAAREAGVRRFIHIGTEAALFDGHDLIDIDETHPYPERHRFLYSETKAEAERRVLAADSEAMSTLSLRPRLIWGPRDTSVLPGVLKTVERGGFAWLDGGRQRSSTVHVSNLAAAVELALTRGAGGRAYFITDDGVRTYKAFLTELAATAGVTLPERAIPSKIARPVADAIGWIWTTFGLSSPPPAVPFSVYMLSATVTVSSARARAELGYAPVISVEEGLRQLAEAGEPAV